MSGEPVARPFLLTTGEAKRVYEALMLKGQTLIPGSAGRRGYIELAERVWEFLRTEGGTKTGEMPEETDQQG